MILFISIDLILYSLSNCTDVDFFYSDMFEWHDFNSVM